MKKYKILTIISLISSVLMYSSCFDLTEEAYSEIISESFEPSDQDVAALLASTYTPLSYIMNWQGYFDLQEEPADVIITPTRPNGWDDGGTYRRMHQHTWDSQQWQPYSVYLMCYEGINNANRVKDQIESGALPLSEEQMASTIAELRGVRALWYSILIDTHGNVPLVTKFTDEIPEQATRKQVFEFIETEITEIIDDLSTDKDATTYGKVNRYVADMILARLYLNAEVYIGEPRYEDAITYVDDIINSGLYSLATNYSDNFLQGNDASSTPEFILAVPFDEINCQFTQHAKWYPPISRDHFGWSYQCWGGSCANPQFINSYQEGDNRLEYTWLMGPQYSATDPTQLVWTCENYLPSLQCSQDGKNYTSIDWGYRVMKYEPSITSSWGWGNDVPFYRYAEALYIKAECLLRLGRDLQTAADLVTSVRMRSFDDPAQATVTVADLQADTKVQYGLVEWGDLDARQNEFTTSGDQSAVEFGGMYDEWGWEFACEFQRRTHMIRFGTYSTKDWFNHTAIPDGHTALFPIPFDEMNANSNLKQNPGY